MPEPSRYDVAIIGAGLAGLATCVLLRNEGLSVVCLDGQAYPHSKVGESLDWSSPGLLQRLGIGADGLLADEIATYKKKIVVCELGRPEWMASPPPQIAKDPLRFETVTLHVDRAALDARLYERARAQGTSFVWERVTSVDWSGDRVMACTTATNRRIDARWYVDASGTARVFSRAMDIPVTLYGRQKVCLWAYFDTPPLHDGTVFFVDNREEYLSWIWDIPISPHRTSVGFVLPAEVVRDRRRAGDSVEKVLRDALARHTRFAALLDRTPALAVESMSFQPYVTQRVCGANWLMAGEAASMPDPLTGNGVTSGIRHARHAAEAILAVRTRDLRGPHRTRRSRNVWRTGLTPVRNQLTSGQRRAYNRHVCRLGHSFNSHIENAVYRHPVRWGLGLKTATYVYTLFAFFMNALHARFDPRGRAAMATFALLFGAARMWIAGWTLVARAALWVRRPA